MLYDIQTSLLILYSPPLYSGLFSGPSLGENKHTDVLYESGGDERGAFFEESTAADQTGRLPVIVCSPAGSIE